LLARAETDGPGLIPTPPPAEYATREQSWFRAVALLPDPAAFLPTVIDACRTNIPPVSKRLREPLSGATLS
jgi:hypothetical protein